MSIILNLKEDLNNIFFKTFSVLKKYNILKYSNDLNLEYQLLITDMELDNINHNIFENEKITILAFNMDIKYKDYENITEILSYNNNNISKYNLQTIDDIFYYNLIDRKIMSYQIDITNNIYFDILPNKLYNIQHKNINNNDFEEKYNNSIIILDRNINNNYNKIIKESKKKIIKPILLDKYYYNLHITEDIKTFITNISELKSSFLIIDETNEYYNILNENFNELIYNINYDNLNEKINNYNNNLKYIKFKSLGLLYKNFILLNFTKNILNIL